MVWFGLHNIWVSPRPVVVHGCPFWGHRTGLNQTCEHYLHLDKVLEAIEQAGITLSPNKCHLFYRSILLLGHKVSRLGFSTHLEKVKAILELECPKKLSQLQKFLGMVVYFSAFIPYYASICAPLFNLLWKHCCWKWGAEEEHAFQVAKDALRSSPVLGHPIEGWPYQLYTDVPSNRFSPWKLRT